MRQTVSRLFFSVFWLAAIGALAVPAPRDGKPPVPADLAFTFKPVPADENGILLWRRAADLESPLTTRQAQIIKYCWTPAAKDPSADDLADLQAWLKRNQDALNLFDESLKKPRMQWPERNLQAQKPELKSFPLLVHARLFQADRLAEENKFSEAVQVLTNTLQATQAGVESDAGFVPYLIAMNLRASTQDAILRLAYRKQMPLPLLKDLLKVLPPLDSETNTYVHVWRSSFDIDYQKVLDLKKLADDWANEATTNGEVALTIFPQDMRRPFRVLLDPSLVPLHPKPFDANAEIRDSIRYFRIYRTNALGLWMDRNSEIEEEQTTGEDKLRRDIAPLMELVKDESLPLSRQAAQKARAAYLEIENPIGRIIATSQLRFVGSDFCVFKARTDRNATRACIALAIFEQAKGKLPASLSELVDEKILDAVPIDLFSGEPLHYSREKRKLWSVGADGEDDHGDAGKSRWAGSDAVWDIPELN